MSEPESSGPATRASWVGLGALAVILCCAGPALVAGGALAAIGGFLGNRIVIVVGAALALGAVAGAAYTRARRSRACASVSSEDREY